jgi:hypothetical protein
MNVNSIIFIRCGPEERKPGTLQEWEERVKHVWLLRSWEHVSRHVSVQIYGQIFHGNGDYRRSKPDQFPLLPNVKFPEDLDYSFERVQSQCVGFLFDEFLFVDLNYYKSQEYEARQLCARYEK